MAKTDQNASRDPLDTEDVQLSIRPTDLLDPEPGEEREARPGFDSSGLPIGDQGEELPPDVEGDEEADDRDAAPLEEETPPAGDDAGGRSDEGEEEEEEPSGGKPETPLSIEDRLASLEAGNADLSRENRILAKRLQKADQARQRLAGSRGALMQKLRTRDGRRPDRDRTRQDRDRDNRDLDGSGADLTTDDLSDLGIRSRDDLMDFVDQRVNQAMAPQTARDQEASYQQSITQALQDFIYDKEIQEDLADLGKDRDAFLKDLNASATARLEAMNDDLVGSDPGTVYDAVYGIVSEEYLGGHRKRRKSLHKEADKRSHDSQEELRRRKETAQPAGTQRGSGRRRATTGSMKSILDASPSEIAKAMRQRREPGWG